jgi:hypothetical protein
MDGTPVLFLSYFFDSDMGLMLLGWWHIFLKKSGAA